MILQSKSKGGFSKAEKAGIQLCLEKYADVIDPAAKALLEEAAASHAPTHPRKYDAEWWRRTWATRCATAR